MSFTFSVSDYAIPVTLSNGVIAGMKMSSQTPASGDYTIPIQLPDGRVGLTKCRVASADQEGIPGMLADYQATILRTPPADARGNMLVGCRRAGGSAAANIVRHDISSGALETFINNTPVWENTAFGTFTAAWRGHATDGFPSPVRGLATLNGTLYAASYYGWKTHPLAYDSAKGRAGVSRYINSTGEFERLFTDQQMDTMKFYRGGGYESGLLGAAGSSLYLAARSLVSGTYYGLSMVTPGDAETSIEPLARNDSGHVYGVVEYESKAIVFGEFGTTDTGLPGMYICAYTGTTGASVGDFNGIVHNAFSAGSCLYAAGAFTAVNGTAIEGLGRYDGAAWYPVGRGLRVSSASGTISAVAGAISAQTDGTSIVCVGKFRSVDTGTNEITWAAGTVPTYGYCAVYNLESDVWAHSDIMNLAKYDDAGDFSYLSSYSPRGSIFRCGTTISIGLPVNVTPGYCGISTQDTTGNGLVSWNGTKWIQHASGANFYEDVYGASGLITAMARHGTYDFIGGNINKIGQPGVALSACDVSAGSLGAFYPWKPRYDWSITNPLNPCFRMTTRNSERSFINASASKGGRTFRSLYETAPDGTSPGMQPQTVGTWATTDPRPWFHRYQYYLMEDMGYADGTGELMFEGYFYDGSAGSTAGNPQWYRMCFDAGTDGTIAPMFSPSLASAWHDPRFGQSYDGTNWYLVKTGTAGGEIQRYDNPGWTSVFKHTDKVVGGTDASGTGFYRYPVDSLYLDGNLWVVNQTSNTSYNVLWSYDIAGDSADVRVMLRDIGTSSLFHNTGGMRKLFYVPPYLAFLAKLYGTDCGGTNGTALSRQELCFMDPETFDVTRVAHLYDNVPAANIVESGGRVFLICRPVGSQPDNIYRGALVATNNLNGQVVKGRHMFEVTSAGLVSRMDSPQLTDPAVYTDARYIGDPHGAHGRLQTS